MKECRECHAQKPIECFYKHQKMLDGHLNKCIDCVKARIRSREKRLREESFDWVMAERERGREKYHRLNYSMKSQLNRQPSKHHRQKYPERYKAYKLSQRIPKKKGFHNHHWNYNEPMDVIEMTIEEHYVAHRFLVYDQKTALFRTLWGDLLNTREHHERYLKKMIKHSKKN